MDKEQIFKLIQKSPASGKRKMISELCRGKNVLDVGCVGQDFDHANPLWLHNLIRSEARELDGTDTDPEGLKKLKEKGYSVFSSEELKATGRRYEVIVIADVLEHVNDPVAFLQFYSHFLKEGGIIVITTPNAHGIRNFSNILFRNNYPVNPEHTMWLCPKTILEVLERANLYFKSFYWLDEYYPLKEVKGIRFRFIYRFNRCMQRIRTNFHPNFMIIASK